MSDGLLRICTQMYLANFGYLHPALKNISSNALFHVSKEAYRHGIAEFQSFAGLEPTGKIILMINQPIPLSSCKLNFIKTLLNYCMMDLNFLIVELNDAGVLDEKTLEVMNKPRCGVPDREYHTPSATTPPTRRKRFSVEGINLKKK